MSPDDLLGPPEIWIVRAPAQGDTRQAIAARLGIAPSRVRTHLATIHRKLDVSSKLDLHARPGDPLPAADMPADRPGAPPGRPTGS